MLRTYQLPNGMSIYHLNKQETDFVYDEIFNKQIYLQYDISLKEDAIVFDIGANIGLFTIFIKEKYPDSRIYAFEPSTEAFKVLKKNTHRYCSGVNIYQYGISNVDKEAVFTYYPKNSITSGFYGNIEEERRFLMNYITTYLTQTWDNGKVPPPWYVTMFVDDLLSEKQVKKCRLRGISNVITEMGINRIDLLKIDAEKCEMEIITGIIDDHWKKIDQVVMEAHESKYVSPDRLCDFLVSKGFIVMTEKQKDIDTTGIGNIYAKKK